MDDPENNGVEFLVRARKALESAVSDMDLVRRKLEAAGRVVTAGKVTLTSDELCRLRQRLVALEEAALEPDECLVALASVVVATSNRLFELFNESLSGMALRALAPAQSVAKKHGNASMYFTETQLRIMGFIQDFRSEWSLPPTTDKIAITSK